MASFDPSAILCCCYTDCVKPVTDPTLERAQKSLGQKISDFLCLGGNFEHLKKERAKLAGQAETLQEKASEVDLKQKECRRAVIDLQNDIRVCQAEDATLDKIYKDLRRCICGCTPNLGQRSDVATQVSAHLVKVRSLLQTAEAKNRLEPLSPEFCKDRSAERGEEFPLPTTKIVGINSSKLEKLKALVRDDACKIIGVYGQGGVGKSTLLQVFNNYLLQETGEFQVVIYHTVSNDKGLDVESVQKKIYDRLGLEWPSVDDPAATLKRELRKKRYVLILDDVWRQFDLETVGIPSPYGDIKGKLIVVSRTEEVCRGMGCDQRCYIEVQSLNDVEAMELFKSNLSEEALKAIEWDSKKYAWDIVGQCEGLPLTLTVFGKTLANITSRDHWKRYRDMIKSSIANIDASDVKLLLTRLATSYELLEEKLKPCLLYCCLFPEDYSIPEEQLFEYWTAEELIKDKGAGADLQGIQYIRKLKAANLLSTGDTESEVKMHDIIHDMAKWVACKKDTEELFLVGGGYDIKTAPKRDKWKVAEKISLVNTQIEELPESPVCDALITLFLQSNPYLSRLPENFFIFMPLLRVLDLSYTAITKILIAEGALPELRYLNLCNTCIESLPEGLGSSIKLIFLDLSRNYCLKEIPQGVFSRLSKLQVLNTYCSRVRIGEISGVRLEELERMVEIRNLGIMVCSAPDIHMLFHRNMFQTSTRYLGLENCEDLHHIHLSELRRLSNVKELSISSCSELGVFWLDAEVEDNVEEGTSLEVLTLRQLPKLQSMSEGMEPIPYFKKLRELIIVSCDMLETTNWVSQLPSLEELTISECRHLEQVLQNTTYGRGLERPEAFRRLKTMILANLPGLKRICESTLEFPCLQSLRVSECHKLRTLPLGTASATKSMRVISGEKEWWENLAWEEAAAKTRFEDYFGHY